jgi:hypothetical protein
MCHPVRSQRFERDLRERESSGVGGDIFPAGDLRAGDADRERAVELLRVHAAAGRLTIDELEQRLERVYAARTGRDLRAELSDLPAERPRRRARRPAAAVPFGLVALLVVAAGAITGAWWLLWLIWPAAVVLGRGADHGHRRLRA